MRRSIRSRLRPLARAASALVRPIAAENRDLLRARWNDLPESLRDERQAVGRQIVHCGYTLGAAYCSFGCTHCYLPPAANRVPIPSLEEMQAQIDANRRLLGENGALQITGGDVVDAYWRAGRAEELIAIVRYANDAGVVPMLMTHGQVLLENPDYLARLVHVGGLRKIAIHIDTTQAGRPGYALKNLRSESDLHPLRQAFVELIHDVRRRTGVPFAAAHTVTVTQGNAQGVGEILRWLIADPRRLDAFRMVSFQTEADVGRTRCSASPVSAERVWGEVCAGIGTKLPRDNLWFGHPECSNMSTLLVAYPERRIVNVIPADPESRRYWSSMMDAFGGLGSRGERSLESLARRAGALARNPRMVWKTFVYAYRRGRAEGLAPVAWRAVTGRVRPLNVVLHNFMSREQVERREGQVSARLAACSFRGAVQRDGEWVAVPMCAMNVEWRETLYADARRSASGETTPLRVSAGTGAAP